MRKRHERALTLRADDVRALAAGKTQICVPITLTEFKRTDTKGYDWTFRYAPGYRVQKPGAGLWQDFREADLIAHERFCPFACKRLWVRETWGAVSPHEDFAPIAECRYEYRADKPAGYLPGDWHHAPDDAEACRWRSATQMPRYASRFDLEVQKVTVGALDDESPWAWFVDFKVVAHQSHN